MKYIIANWKANLADAEVWQWRQRWQDLTRTEAIDGQKTVVVAPTSIFYTWAKTQDWSVEVALQDISVFDGGAHTGEVTRANLADLAPKYVIIGHSERRRDMGETNQIVAQKARQVWQMQSVPIVCVDVGEVEELAALLSNQDEQPLILAYEPVSAISTSGGGGNLPVVELVSAIAEMRRFFPRPPIIYGGSVTAANAADYSSVCDGLLVGSASLQADEFYRIAQAF
jgi:triosephosphate isomerase